MSENTRTVFIDGMWFSGPDPWVGGGGDGSGQMASPAPSPSPVVEVSEEMIEAAGKVLLEQVDEYHFPSFDCIRRCLIAALRVR